MTSVFVNEIHYDNDGTDIGKVINTGQSFGSNGGGGDFLAIYDIQSANQTSPFAGNSVNTQGVVTAIATNGFYIQDPAGDGNVATSDGIFVFTGGSPSVSVGNSVEVEGTVTEFLPGGNTQNLTITQITRPKITTLTESLGQVTPTILGTGGRITPTQIIHNDNFTVFDPEQDGIDFYESLEGMQVQVNDAVAVAATNNFGEIWVVGDNGANATGINSREGITISGSSDGNPLEDDFNPERIQIDDTLFDGDSPQVQIGDGLGNVTGVVSYGFGNFEVLPTVAPTVTPGNLATETTNLVGNSDRLTIASFNVLNLDPNDSDGDEDIANDQFDRIATQITNNLQSPDIIGLQEIQDSDGSVNSSVVDANLTYQTLINAIVAAGGPEYQFLEIPPEDDTSGGQPGGNIRVGYLYNPDRVDFVEGSLERVEDPNLADGNAFEDSRIPLAATFIFNAQEVKTVVNHFTSKSGSSPLFGAVQPPINGGEDQRIAQAQVVKNYADNILTTDPNARVVVLGDLNEFQFFPPLEILQGDNLTNLTFTLPENERYSFIFEGNSQEIDHILVSDSLVNSAEYDAVHVNTGFLNPASDHNPILGRFTITAPVNEIIGTSSRDRIFGLDSRDTLIGGAGEDTLTGGGANSDTFVYQTVQDRTDRITDFNITEDRIDLSQIFDNPQYSSDTPFEDYINLVQLGANTAVRIDANGDRFNFFDRTLTILEDTTANSVTENNFTL